MARDKQVSKVYAWERAAGIVVEAAGWRSQTHSISYGHGTSRVSYRVDGAPALSLTACQVLICRVWWDYGRDPSRAPRVKDGRRTTWARATWDNRINLPRWARTRGVVLHEIAHALGHYPEAHGPQFVRLFIELLARYTSRTVPELRRSAREHGVKVATAGSVQKPVRRRS